MIKFLITAKEDPKTAMKYPRQNIFYLTHYDGIWYEVIKYFRGNYSVKALPSGKVNIAMVGKFEGEAVGIRKIERIFLKHLAKMAEKGGSVKIASVKRAIAVCNFVSGVNSGFEHGVEYLVVNMNYSPKEMVVVNMYGKNTVTYKHYFLIVKELS